MADTLVAFDRAIVSALCSLMGESAGVFMLRVRDLLTKLLGNEGEANKLINSFLAAHEAPCFDISDHTGHELSHNGARVVRRAILDVIDDLMGANKEVFAEFVARHAREKFSKDLNKAIKELNEAIHGEPIEDVKVLKEEGKIIVKLKFEEDILAYLLANIVADYPRLESKEGSTYIFRIRS